MYLLDPKYKLVSDLPNDSDGDANDDVVAEALGPSGSPKKTDIDKMHSYRDAIRDEMDRRVVMYAAILYSGPDVRFHKDIEALSASPGSDSLRVELRNRLQEWLT